VPLAIFPETLLATRGAPDPKRHGQAVRSAMKAEWILSQTSEMYGLWRRGVFQKVLHSSLNPQDRVFTSYFYYKIKVGLRIF